MRASGPILECDWIVPYQHVFIWLPISVIWAHLPSLPMASPWILVQRKLGMVGAGLGLMSLLNENEVRRILLDILSLPMKNRHG